MRVTKPSNKELSEAIRSRGLYENEDVFVISIDNSGEQNWENWMQTGSRLALTNAEILTDGVFLGGHSDWQVKWVIMK